MRKGNLSPAQIYEEALRKWGLDVQVAVACGELAELQVALVQHFVQRKASVDEVIDELADARIMIEQMEQILLVSDRVKFRRGEKLDRLEAILTRTVQHPHQ